jgi:hypothetical protein
MEIKSEEDARMFVIGATIMGTGGGGDEHEGLRLLKEALESGDRIRILSLDTLPEESVVATPYFVGSVAKRTGKSEQPTRISEPISVAVGELEEVLGKKITAFTATELGGLNTSVALYIAARMGLPMVDGDLIGRAGPELHQCTANIFNIPMCPSAIVTKTGNIVVIKGYGSIDDYEKTARYLSVLAGHSASVVDTPMTLPNAKKAVVTGTVSLCYRIGKAVLEARESSGDPVAAIAKELHGWKFFEGTVTSFTPKDEGGFLKAEALLDGVGEYAGHALRSWIMNEHIMAWVDDKPAVMPPDLIILLRENGQAVTNTELEVGMRLTAITSKAPAVWRTRRGLELFGPKHFGFREDYVPVERLLQRRK